jgi:hypothetical protein
VNLEWKVVAEFGRHKTFACFVNGKFAGLIGIRS